MKRARTLTRAASLGVATSAGLLPGAAVAGVWSTTPELSASAQYSTNPQLLTVDSGSGSAAVANVGLPLDWNDGAQSYEFAPRARLAEAAGTSPIGRNGYYLSGSARADTEVGSLTFGAHWADDSAAIAAPAAGTLTRLDIAQRETDAHLGWTRLVSERLQSAFSAQWQRQDYGFIPGSGLYDYRYSAIGESLQESLTARLALQLVASVSRYESPQLAFREDSQTVQVGITRQLTEKWNYSLLGGRSRVQSPRSAGSASGSVYSVNVGWKGLKSSLSGGITQSYQPSGFGTLTLTREATLRGDFNRAERLSAYLWLRSVTTADTVIGSAFTGRNYQSATLGATWAVNEVWTLDISGNYQRQKIEFGDQSSNGTGAILAINRRFGRMTFQ